MEEDTTIVVATRVSPMENVVTKLEVMPSLMKQRELFHAFCSFNHKCYILDCGNEIYTWFGRATQGEERKSASQAAEDCVALLAYEEPLQSSVGYLLEHKQREVVADDVNSMVLATNPNLNGSQQNCLHSNLKKLLRQLTACSLERRSLNGNQGESADILEIFTAIFKMVTDAATLDLLYDNEQRCLAYASKFIRSTISCLKRCSHDEFDFQGDQFEEIQSCLKSSFSYGAKLLNLSLANLPEELPLPTDIHNLSNDLLDLISSVEIYCGSAYAAKLVTVSKQWLLDLILGLASNSMFTHSVDYRKHVPSWLKLLAKIEINRLRDAASDEEAEGTNTAEEFPAFKKLTDKSFWWYLNFEVIDLVD